MKHSFFQHYTRILLLGCIGSMILLYSSCERDDICAPETQTTPLLVIKFLDDAARTEIKAPSDLSVKAIGDDVNGSGEDNNEFTLQGNVRDSISIPLRTQGTSTQFELTINSSVTDTTDEALMPNTDTLTIEYTTEEVFVSSACGFKINYNDISQTLTTESGSGNWIKGITIQRSNITDETEAHLFIFH